MNKLSRILMLTLVVTGLLFAAETFAQQPLPVTSPPIQIPPAMLPPPSQPGLDGAIVWDAEQKNVSVAAGTAQAQFTFNLTNISKSTITISSVSTSCGCTVAQLPQTPWPIAPGVSGQISATMNMGGVVGSKTKTLTVNSDRGAKLLTVTGTILAAPADAQPMSALDREANQKLAIADRQAVFKGDCASCHAAPAKDKTGQPLYVAVCGVCHEATHRATMVSDLHKLPYATTPEIWRNWITHGKPGGLMPAFGMAEGGILTDEQINSLVTYLVSAMPSQPNATPAPAIPAAH